MSHKHWHGLTELPLCLLRFFNGKPYQLLTRGIKIKRRDHRESHTVLSFAAPLLLPKCRDLPLLALLEVRFQSTRLLLKQHAARGDTLRIHRNLPSIPVVQVSIIDLTVIQASLNTSENLEQIFDIASRTINCSDEKQLISMILPGFDEENHLAPHKHTGNRGEDSAGRITALLRSLKERGKHDIF